MAITKKDAKFNANSLQWRVVLLLPENNSNNKTPDFVSVHPISSRKKQT
ncbi:hypothetical protein NLI92_004233 [Priestia megaterium]|nr:hypothetical protein [Priestia megaterium]MCR8928811.1 hypothetical protein [Priestia megaterium]